MNSPKLRQLQEATRAAGRLAMVLAVGASVSLTGLFIFRILGWNVPAAAFGFAGFVKLIGAAFYLAEMYRRAVAAAWQDGYERAMDEKSVRMRRDGATLRSDG